MADTARPDDRSIFRAVVDTVGGLFAAGLPRPQIQNSTPISGITAQSGEAWSMFTGQLGDSGIEALSTANAPSVTAIHACWSLIAGAISALPLHVYNRLADGEREQLFDEPLWWTLNESFNPRWSSAKGWEYLVTSMLAHGDGFLVIERQGPRIIGLRPVHPLKVEVAASEDGRRLLYRVTSDWRDGSGVVGQRVYDQDDIIHVAGPGFDGLRSMSPLRSYLRMAGSVALATQEYAARFFSQGARPDYILKGANDPTNEQLTRLRDEIDAHHRGVSNSRRPMILTGGLEFQSISLPLEDVQLLALRQFQVEEIARAYLVPPFMIGHNEKTTSWGSGVEAMGVGFVRYTLRNYLNTIETEFNRKLYRGGNKFLAFDTTELERADTKSLFESFRIALGRAGEKPFMTSDEVRQRLNLKRTTGGDSMEMAGTQPKDAADAQAV